MMFGYADDWTVLLYALGLLWPLCGPFVMIFLGVACGRARGRGRKVAFLCSAGIPAVTVGVLAVAMFQPDRGTPEAGDVIGFVGVYFLLLTVLPWVAAYGVSRWRAKRSSGKEGSFPQQRQP